MLTIPANWSKAGSCVASRAAWWSTSWVSMPSCPVRRSRCGRCPILTPSSIQMMDAQDHQAQQEPPQYRRLPPGRARRRARTKMRDAAERNRRSVRSAQGIVKNITDFGVFIDLGGVDGLLHITDMSWGRIRHPSRNGLAGRQDRRQDSRFRREDLAHFARPETDDSVSVGKYRREISRSARRSPAGWFRSPITARSSSWRRVSRD